jgi:hypothetical protein
LMLVLLGVVGNNGCDKKEQNSCSDKSNWFHEYASNYGDFMRHAPGGPRAVIASQRGESE